MKVDQLDLLLCLLAICHIANPAQTDSKRYKKTMIINHEINILKHYFSI
jgi:hypothetical protein